MLITLLGQIANAGPYVSEGVLASAHMSLLGSERPQGRFIRYQIQQIG